MFHTETKNGVTFLTADPLRDGGVLHGFSTRLGGVSPAPWDSLNLDDRRGDDPANVRENFRRLCAALDMDVRRAVLSRQVHRDDVRTVTAADAGKGLWTPRDYDSADALITDVPGLPLVVFSADCNVILLYDPVRRAVGAAHAGWRGTAAGIGPCGTPTAATRRTSGPPSALPSGPVALKRTTMCPMPSVKCWAMKPPPS